MARPRPDRDTRRGRFSPPLPKRRPRLPPTSRASSATPPAGVRPRACLIPSFGVGPISDGSPGEVDRRLRPLERDRWLYASCRKTDEQGPDIGGYTASEIARSMHRGEPEASILRDIHRFGLSAAPPCGASGRRPQRRHRLHSAPDDNERPGPTGPCPHCRPEIGRNEPAGLFRHSWAARIIDLCRLSKNGTTERPLFACDQGSIPSLEAPDAMAIRLFIGGCHETTGATSHTAAGMAGSRAREPPCDHWCDTAVWRNALAQ